MAKQCYIPEERILNFSVRFIFKEFKEKRFVTFYSAMFVVRLALEQCIPYLR
jgi:hypothetical protein